MENQSPKGRAGSNPVHGVFNKGENMEEEEFEYDMIRGSYGKKPKLAALNKAKLSSYELDELFLDY